MRLFFVTDRADAHATRFDALFSSLSTEYERVQLSVGGEKPSAEMGGQMAHTWEGIRELLGGEDSVVVSGPLDSVSWHLGSGKFRHVGISFATDVMVSAAGSPTETAALSRLLPTLDYVVTDNYATENALVALGARQDAIIRIPWGPESFDSPSRVRRADLGWPEDRKIVFYPRSLEAHYEPGLFVEALKLLVNDEPHLLAVFIESGSMVGSVKKQVSDAGLVDHVRWESLQSPVGFSQMLSVSDVVVVTPRTDGTSVTVMEAMACGIPVVSSLTAGSAEWVIDGITGWSFPVGDAPGLADAVARALGAEEEQRSTILSHARRLVEEKAGWERSREVLGLALRTMLEGKTPRAKA